MTRFLATDAGALRKPPKMAEVALSQKAAVASAIPNRSSKRPLPLQPKIAFCSLSNEAAFAELHRAATVSKLKYKYFHTHGSNFDRNSILLKHISLGSLNQLIRSAVGPLDGGSTEARQHGLKPALRAMLLVYAQA